MKDVSVGLGGTAGAEPVSESNMSEAIEPGNLEMLSDEPSGLRGRGGTIGGGSLNGLDSGAVSAVGESCSLEREYLRKWFPPEAMRLGANLEGVLVPVLLLVSGVLC